MYECLKLFNQSNELKLFKYPLLGFWGFGGVGREIEETPDAAAGIANRCERRIGIDPEAHVAGGISNAGVWESGDKVKEFFCCC